MVRIGRGDQFPSQKPSLSGDGRFVAFSSGANGLVPGDDDDMPDLFLYKHDDTPEMTRIPLVSAPKRSISAPSLSRDGRFIAFTATGLVAGDPDGDSFLYDTSTQTLEPLIPAPNESDGVFGSGRPSISGDGRFIAFGTSSRLVDDDSGSYPDIYVALNSKAIGSDAKSVSLFAGEIVSNIDFGVVPNPGEIRGRCFDDVIANGVSDTGEPGVAGCTIYLDQNSNGRFDPADISTVSAADGSYAFTNLEAELEYRVGLASIPSGQSLVLPSAQDNGLWRVFLPAGGTIGDRDFGLRPADTLGQFENAVIQGRLFIDTPGDSQPGIPGVTLFVDLDDDGIRDFNEPRTLSASDNPSTIDVNEDGEYTFTGLGSRPYTVRVLDVPPDVRQETPIGNAFTRQTHPLAVPSRLLGGPQDVVAADFNNDGWPDLAIAMSDGNAVSILLNDGRGGYPATPIDISLAPANLSAPRGEGAFALVAGDFNGQGGMDLAVANSDSGNVAILLDFDGSRFSSPRYVSVAEMPMGIAAGDLLDNDGDLDLVVTSWLPNTTGSAKNVALLRNNGQGTFTAVGNPPSAGNNPSGVVVGHFNGDALLDLAVTNYGLHPAGADLGNVRVLFGNASGGFQSQTVCRTATGSGAGPAALATADLNGDKKLDLAVANFLSDNVTLCLGNGDGTFQPATLLPGGSGPTDIAAADIDGDEDLDLLITNAKNQKVGLLRNRLIQGAFEFEPAENFGTATFASATRLTLAAADINRDLIIDLAVASSQQNAVAVHMNSLIGGAQRLTLDGIQTESGVDFAFQQLNAPPTLDEISAPQAIDEDSADLTVGLSGISPGTGESQQPLVITVATDNGSLIAASRVEHVPDAETGSVVLSLAADRWGQATVTVRVTDGGLDGILNTTADNAHVERSFVITVRPVNDLPTTTPDSRTVSRYRSNHVLDVLDNDTFAPDVDEILTLIFVDPLPAEKGTLVVEDNRFFLRYTPAAGFEGSFVTRYFVSDGHFPVAEQVTVNVIASDNPWHNSVNPHDVTGDGHVVAADILEIVNFINAFGSGPVPIDADPGPPFFDVTDDGFVAPNDALAVVNVINARVSTGEGEASASSAARDSFFDDPAHTAVRPVASDESDGEEHLLDLLASDGAVELGGVRRRLLR
jgi:hypothetical protein